MSGTPYCDNVGSSNVGLRVIMSGTLVHTDGIVGWGYIQSCCYILLHPFIASLEIKKKLYSSILVVGGGLSFGNVSNMLNARLQLKLPIVLTKGLEDMEIFTNPRVRPCLSHPSIAIAWSPPLPLHGPHPSLCMVPIPSFAWSPSSPFDFSST